MLMLWQMVQLGAKFDWVTEYLKDYIIHHHYDTIRHFTNFNCRFGYWILCVA